VHILLILKNIADKCRTGSHIDRIICAEIPDPNEDKELYDIVKAHMIHGPCGDLNPESPCMKKEKCMGRCCARYPYKLCEETRADRDGYPTYRRRKAAPIIDEIGNKYFNIDSSWVVPYNPYLLKKYDTHINVEIATSVKSFKYIFKYVYKGGDRAEVKVHKIFDEDDYEEGEFVDVDELKAFIDSVYLSSHEAVWRIFGFPTNCISHSVVNLPLHVDNGQSVVFREGWEEEAVGNGAPDTMLTAFLKLNQGEGVDQEERDLARVTVYQDIPKYFTWNKTKKCGRAGKKSSHQAWLEL